MFEVIYYSLTGSTRKLAEAIADELGVSAEEAKTNAGLAKGSLVFLGPREYGPLRGWGLKQFIEGNDFRGRKVALFGTSGNGAGQEVQALEELVVTQGADVVGTFYCAGQFLVLVNPYGDPCQGRRRSASGSATSGRRQA